MANVDDPNTTVTMPAMNVTVRAEYVDRTETPYPLNVTRGSGSGQYPAGRVVAVAADLPVTGQFFVKWTGETARMANPNLPNTTLLMPNQEVSIVARFLTKPDQDYNLAVTSGTGSGAYPVGRTVRIVAYPRTGEVFDKWVDQTDNVANVNLPSTTVTMPAGNVSVEAVYKEPSTTPRTIIIQKHVPEAPQAGPQAAAARELASNIQEATHLPSQWVDLETPAADNGFVFDRWVGQTGHVENVNLPNTRIWMPDHDVTVVAEYRDPGEGEFVLTVNSGSANPGGPTRQGTEVSIMADNPEKEDKIFDQWEGQTGQVADIYAASTTLFMPGFDVTVTATYKEDTPQTTYTMTYHGNDNTGGAVPVDEDSPYTEGVLVTVLGNTGNLTRDGFTFNNWNTQANGGGTSYAPDDTFTIIENVTLYAQWTAVAPDTYTVTYDGNGNTSGNAPVDGDSPYDADSEVTVLGPGDLGREGFTFNNWNTQANGGGTSYDPGDTFTIIENVTLYAQWTAVAPVAIPALSQWGLIVMTGLMLITFVIMHRRRQGLV